MKKQVFIFLFCFATFAAFAQNTATQKPAQSIPRVKKCHIPADTAITLKVTLDQAKSWADSVPLAVICDDLKTYKLYNFDFTIMTMNPMQSREFGTGNGGIPILAKKAINGLQPKDAIILKNPTYLDENGKEQPLPVITFSIKE